MSKTVYYFQNNDACIDLQGEAIKSREQLAAPNGWEWTQDWVIDSNRAVDENGMSFNAGRFFSLSMLHVLSITLFSAPLVTFLVLFKSNLFRGP
jgi:disulfide bond formation protein DsbB